MRYNEAKLSQSENCNEIYSALAKAQGAMTAASKDAKNPFFNSKYADLSSVFNACRAALSDNGICVLQTTHVNELDQTYLKTVLGHGSGQWISSEIKIDIPPPGSIEIDKYGKEKKVNIMQALGSILTYQKRYQLSSIVGVAPAEDDDGNASNYSLPAQQYNNSQSAQNQDYRQPPKNNPPPPPPPPVLPPKIKMINNDQLIDLNEQLKKCDEQFKEKLSNLMKDREISDYSQFSERFFTTVMKSISKHLEEALLEGEKIA